MDYIRQNLRDKRKNISPDYRKKAAEAIADPEVLKQLLAQYPDVKNVAVYLALSEELQLSYLIEQLWAFNINTYCPFMHPVIDRAMFFIKYDENTPMTKDKYGITAPVFNAKHILAPWELDLVFSPLVGFDLKGNRIGMGGGCYDTSFQFRQQHQDFYIPLIGCAYECQLCEAIIPNPWDQPLDGVLTEKRLNFF